MARDLGAIPTQTAKPASQGRDLGIDQSSATLAHSQQAIDQLRVKQQQAEQAAQVAQAPATVAKETGKGIVGSLFDPLVKAGRTAVQAVGEAFGAKNPQEQYTGLAGTPQQTLQADVQQGKSVPQAAGEFALEAASVLPLGKGAQMAKQAGKGILESEALAPVVNAIKKPIAKVGAFLDERAAKKAEDKAIQTSVDALTPKMTPTELQDAKTTKAGFFKSPKVDMSGDTNFMETANSLKGIVKGKSAIEDKNTLEGAINNTSENVVRPFLSSNQVKTYFGDFIKKLELVQPKTPFKTGTPQFENYNRVREEIINRTAQFLKGLPDRGGMTDMNSYWDARKMIDDVLDTETKGKVFGDPVREGAVAASQDMRQGMQQYILDSLQYPGQMEKVNHMQDLLQTMRSRGIDIPTEKDAIIALQKQLGIENAPEDVIRSAFFRDQMERMTQMYKGIDYVKTKVPAEFKKGSTVKQIIKNPAVQIGAGGLVGAGTVAGTSKLIGGE